MLPRALRHNMDDDDTASDLRAALFVTDTELARRLGVSEKVWRVAKVGLDRDPTFPKKDPLFGNKRYWRAVRAWFDRHYGLGGAPPTRPAGVEYPFDSPRPKRRHTSTRGE
jgi:hypothetical protein